MGNRKLPCDSRVRGIMEDVKRLYKIKEIFGPTIQGEGSMTGTMTHFIRFSGCNMWNGKPEDKAKSKCPFCDTDFYGGEMKTATEIVYDLMQLGKTKWVTISGGEPLLQYDEELNYRLYRAGYKVAIETNGTKDIDFKVDHITISPKVPLDQVKLMKADDMKLLYPHPNPILTPEMFDKYNADNFYLQPILEGGNGCDNPNMKDALQKIYESNGKWKLSAQLHQLLGLE
jgi:organic radical activating enzyme